MDMMRTKQIRRKPAATVAAEVLEQEPQVENMVAETPNRTLPEAQQGVTTVPDVQDAPDAPLVPDVPPVKPQKRSKRPTQTQAEQPQA